MIVRFGENLGKDVHQGEVTLDCEKKMRIMIHNIIRYNN